MIIVVRPTWKATNCKRPRHGYKDLAVPGHPCTRSPDSKWTLPF